MGSFKCALKSCPNRAGWCYILDLVHLKVLPMQIKIWSIAINEDTASLETPPDILIKSLMPARQNQTNPMRDNPQNSSNSSNPMSTPTPAPSIVAPAPAPVQMPYPMYPMMPQSFQYPYGLPTPYSGPREPIQSHHEVRSSSVISGSDGVEKLATYVAWLVKRNATLATSLFEAKDALISGDFIFETIEHVTDEEFIKMGISAGIKALLKTQIKRFKKAESRGML
jgi:hypothetical protein